MNITNKRKRRYKIDKEFTYKSLITCLTNLLIINKPDENTQFFEVNEFQHKLLDDKSNNPLGHCLYGVNIEINKNISKPRLTSLEKLRDQKINQIINE